jgi:hypothetical protein
LDKETKIGGRLGKERRIKEKRRTKNSIKMRKRTVEEKEVVE